MTTTAKAPASPTVPAITPLIKPPLAPAAAIAPAEFIPTLPIATIVASPSNPRRRFAQAALEELASSIRSRGLIQPILVRPLKDQPGKFEIVAGERRYRAAHIANLTSLPATVQQLDDLAVAEIQLMENTQRQDLNALEEAIGFQNWLKQNDPATGKPHTIDDIAGKVNKSRRHIYNRLALLKLAPEVQDAISAGTLESSKALLLTLVGNHNTQREAMEAFLEADDKGDLPGQRACANYITENLMLDLSKNVPFDPKVIDYKTAAGNIINKTCEACPRRSGNDRDLFADIKSANVCTDVVCYRLKTAAATQRKIDALDTRKVTVIRADQAKSLYGVHGRLQYSSARMDPEDAFHDVPVNSKAYGKPIGALLGDDAPLIHIENPTTHKLETFVDRDKAKRLLSKAGLTKPTASTDNNNPRSADARAREKAEQEKIAAGHKALFLAVRAQCKGALPRAAMESLAQHLFYDCDDPLLGHAWSKTPLENDRAAELHAQAVMDGIKTVSNDQLIGIIFDLILLASQCHPNAAAYKESLPVVVAKEFGLDPARIFKDAAAELKAATKPAKEKPAAPAAKKPNKPAAKPKKEPAAFARPLTVTPALQKITGTTPLPRTAITKAVWDYIKKHNLQDKVNRRMINADATLKAALDTQPQAFSMFEMSRLVDAQIVIEKKPAAPAKNKGRPKNTGVDARMQAQIDKEVLAKERKRAKKK